MVTQCLRKGVLEPMLGSYGAANLHGMFNNTSATEKAISGAGGFFW